MSENLKLGQLISAVQQRDAVHIAVAPVLAGERLAPGQRIGLADGKAVASAAYIGVVDPFLAGAVMPGQWCWLFLIPGSITSLRHEWTHPALSAEPASKSIHEQWMRAWAVEHMNYDYDVDGDLSEDMAYAKALDAGSSMSVGCCESARDYIDGEWWAHWEAITGKRGQRDGYFSCAC